MKALLNVTAAAILLATPATFATKKTPPGNAAKISASVSAMMKTDEQFKQLLLNSQDDASAFAFSDGILRGERIAKTFAFFRRHNPFIKASDMELAIAFLKAN